MANKDLNIIFKHDSDCPTTEMLWKYLEDKLDKKQKHEVEKHLVDCEMCSDQLEGMKLCGKEESEKILPDLKKEFSSIATASETKSRKLKPLYYRIAAAVTVLMLISFVFYVNSFNEEDISKTMSDNTLKETEKTNKTNQKMPVEEEKVITDELEEKEEIGEKGEGEATGEINQQAKSKGIHIEDGLIDTEAGESNIIEEEVMNEETNTKSVESVSTGGEKSNSEIVSADIVSIDEQLDDDLDLADNNRYKRKEEKSLNDVEEKELDNLISQTTVSRSSEVTAGVREKAPVVESSKDRATGKNQVIAKETEPEKDSFFRSIFGSVSDKKSAKTANKKAEESVAEKPKAAYYDATVIADTTQTAFELIKKEEFYAANEILTRILQNNPEDYDALFYAGVCNYYLNNPSVAIKFFDKVLMVKTGRFNDYALWYKAKAEILNDDPISARKTLERIIDNKNKFSRKAKKEMESID